MEDIYTPGYDSLLKRKEAEFRRAKVCKIGALIVAAACTVILSPQGPYKLLRTTCCYKPSSSTILLLLLHLEEPKAWGRASWVRM
ncbi:hypothetical protein SKAU_G00312870 [Synaphobranchus kaupii]|uniref:Major intrinsically disordered Notch2-binding receptor 1-like C-terminal domain-containing protein n=1 Tax=Synaphobranchus kaupii TaxID=118154 RepID=A0A9Q1ES00_SYNKA|nr:hypothetical protein SKAU_G00312870 [Synaphobranchus kaupii]